MSGSGNEQYLVARAIGCPKTHFVYKLAIFWSAKKTLFFHPPSPFHGNFFFTATVLAFVLLRNSRFNFHCYTQSEATPTQKSARKCAVTSRDFLRERLQRAFTRTNQLHQTTQQVEQSQNQPLKGFGQGCFWREDKILCGLV